MAIYLPHVMEPFMGTDEQWAAYFMLQSAGLDYISAYRDTIGIFALFSRSKNRRLKEAQKFYYDARDAYWKSLGITEAAL